MKIYLVPREGIPVHPGLCLGLGYAWGPDWTRIRIGNRVCVYIYIYLCVLDMSTHFIFPLFVRRIWADPEIVRDCPETSFPRP